MKSIKIVSVLLLTFIISLPVFAAAPQKNTLFQVSTYSALTQRVYRSNYPYKKLMRQGDFGLGTFNNVNGEMVALNGHFYQILPNWKLASANPNDTAPFAAVTFFHPSIKFSVKNLKNYNQIKQAILKHFPSKNKPYAIKIVGQFKSLKLRNLKPQRKPFPPIKKVIAEQALLNLKDVSGTAVGFWTPNYLSNLTAPGYHLHFVNKDLTTGGHILNAAVQSATVYLQPINKFTLLIPNNREFIKADLSSANTCAQSKQLSGQS